MLTDISFALRKGQTLGIIGPTGSGKSTLLQLLLRFYDPDAGEIRIDGRRVDSIPHEELHRMFGVVLQSDFVFRDTIRENISFGRNVPDARIARAAAAAQADFLQEKGLDHMLTAKGSNLSGGQRAAAADCACACG